ncbi:hypothetical protein Val02_25960 [Virgisporangium aliadipatigenens]|uniref:Uncharacterized protein n=1 Tax=Virgisporangium aliadipatigenens TaxID=741659 RepID=A0A8J3YKL8_9ACTN|nr:hypothetical protein Val02_25960 [Virgisporangium aliadipatigenens]
MRAGRIAAGVALALTGHVLAAVVPLFFMGNATGGGEGLWLVIGAVLQVLLFLAAVAGGTVLHGRPESRELGLGLLVGWGSGIPVVVVLGIMALMFGLSAMGG